MRVLERENLQLAIGSAIVLLFLAFKGNMAYASTNITCETNFGEKSFTIEDNSVAFHQDNIDGRSISSIGEAKSQKTHTGFKKTMYLNGNKHYIYIHNLEKLSSNNDFLAITSPKGHKMTYPINCNIAQ